MDTIELAKQAEQCIENQAQLSRELAQMVTVLNDANRMLGVSRAEALAEHPPEGKNSEQRAISEVLILDASTRYKTWSDNVKNLTYEIEMTKIRIKSEYQAYSLYKVLLGVTHND